jgi:hypothetical protein
MQTLKVVPQVVFQVLGLNNSSPTPYFCSPTKKTGGAPSMGSYTLTHSICLFFGATCNQVTINN